MRRRRKQGCVVAAPISVPGRGKTPPVGVGGPQGSPFAPPPQPPSGTLQVHVVKLQSQQLFVNPHS